MPCTVTESEHEYWRNKSLYDNAAVVEQLSLLLFSTKGKWQPRTPAQLAWLTYANTMPLKAMPDNTSEKVRIARAQELQAHLGAVTELACEMLKQVPVLVDHVLKHNPRLWTWLQQHQAFDAQSRGHNT